MVKLRRVPADSGPPGADHCGWRSAGFQYGPLGEAVAEGRPRSLSACLTPEVELAPGVRRRSEDRIAAVYDRAVPVWKMSEGSARNAPTVSKSCSERRPQGAGHGVLIADVTLDTDRRGAQRLEFGDRRARCRCCARDDDDAAGKIDHSRNLRTGCLAGRCGWLQLVAYVCACDLPWDPTTQGRAAMPAGPSPPAQGQVRPLRAPGHPRLPGGRPGALVAGGAGVYDVDISLLERSARVEDF